MTGHFTAAILLMTIAGPSVAQEAPFGFPMHDTAVAVPELSFSAADGQSQGLAEYRGTYLLLNIWATWCAPCRAELPTLDALQRTLGGPDFAVVALSTDTGRRPAVERLFTEVSIDTLAPLIDDTGAAMRDLGILALPTTLLIDKDGQEIGRKVGPAEWDSPAAIAFFQGLF